MPCCSRAREFAEHRDGDDGGGNLGLVGAAIDERGGAGEAFEAFHKCAVVVEASVLSDAGDAVGSVFNGVYRVKHPYLLDENLRGHFHVLAEDAHEVARGKAASFGEGGDGDWLGVVAVNVLERGQQAVEFGVAPHDFGVESVDGDEADDFSGAVMERIFAGEGPLGAVGKEVGGMHLIYQRAAMPEDEEVVLTKALGDDFWKKVEVAFSDDFLSGTKGDGFTQSLAHVNVARVEIFDHE